MRCQPRRLRAIVFPALSSHASCHALVRPCYPAHRFSTGWRCRKNTPRINRNPNPPRSPRETPLLNQGAARQTRTTLGSLLPQTLHQLRTRASHLRQNLHPQVTHLLQLRAQSCPPKPRSVFFAIQKGALNWSLRDLSQTLNISRDEAERAVALLQAQGYVQSHKSGEWVTTPSGETVAGAKPPRFGREIVEAALSSLKERIQNTNKDRATKFEITRAVAFGDFLIKDRSRVQVAEVGIELARRDNETSGDAGVVHSAAKRGKNKSSSVNSADAAHC